MRSIVVGRRMTTTSAQHLTYRLFTSSRTEISSNYQVQYYAASHILSNLTNYNFKATQSRGHAQHGQQGVAVSQIVHNLSLNFQFESHVNI